MDQLLLTGKFNEDSGNLNFKNCSNSSFAQNIYFRGKFDSNLLSQTAPKLNDSKLYSNFLSSSYRFNVYQTKKAFMNFESFLSSVSNDQSLLDPIDQVVEKSWDMFNNRSFLHRYEKYNIDSDYFINTFAQIEQTLHSMKKLSV